MIAIETLVGEADEIHKQCFYLVERFKQAQRH